MKARHHALGAIRKLAGLGFYEVDPSAINEALAVVTMAAMHDLDLPHDAIKVHAGACALGYRTAHPAPGHLAAGAGALRRGIASLCNGGGAATAVERLS